MSTFPNFNAAISSCFSIFTFVPYTVSSSRETPISVGQPELPLAKFPFEIKYVHFHLFFRNSSANASATNEVGTNELDSPFFNL